MRNRVKTILDALEDKGGTVTVVVTVLVAVLGAGILVEVVDDNGDGKTDRVTVRLGGHDDLPAGVPAGPAKLELDDEAVDALDAVEDRDAGGHDNLDDETPAGLPAGAYRALPNYLEDNIARNDLPVISPLAAPEQAGCVTRLVGNYSSRYGVRPRQIWAHYTVSRNRPGWDDVNAIVAYFNSPASSASSHYVIDADGNCALIVPETGKAWTQAAANPYAISIEFIAYGDEADLLTAAGYAKAGKVLAAIGRRWDIPLARGAVNTATCTPARPGIVQHADGGACAGGHHDVNPFSVARLIAAAKAAARPPRPTGLALLYRRERQTAAALIRERKLWPASSSKAERRASIDRAKAAKRRLEHRLELIRRRIAAARKAGASRAQARAKDRRGARARVLRKVLARKTLG